MDDFFRLKMLNNGDAQEYPQSSSYALGVPVRYILAVTLSIILSTQAAL